MEKGYWISILSHYNSTLSLSMCLGPSLVSSSCSVSLRCWAFDYFLLLASVSAHVLDPYMVLLVPVLMPLSWRPAYPELIIYKLLWPHNCLLPRVDAHLRDIVPKIFTIPFQDKQIQLPQINWFSSFSAHTLIIHPIL